MKVGSVVLIEGFVGTVRYITGEGDNQVFWVKFPGSVGVDPYDKAQLGLV